MKSSEFVTVDRLQCVVAILTFVMLGGGALGATDPTLEVSLTYSNQNVILSWATFQGVRYQVEAGSSFDGWTNISPVMTGTGATLSFANSRIGQGPEFFRVKRLFPAMQVSASPVTGYVRVTASGFTAPIDVNGALTLSVNGLGGPDVITAGNGLAALGIPLILMGTIPSQAATPTKRSSAEPAMT